MELSLAYWIGGLAVVCQSLGNLCLFLGLRKHRVFFLGGFLLLAVHFVGWCSALRMAPLTRLVPLAALGYPLSTLFARLILRESISQRRWLGVLLVSTGIWLSLKS